MSSAVMFSRTLLRVATLQLQSLAELRPAACEFRRCVATSVVLRQSGDEVEDVEVLDPFLAKLQRQTESSYLELLSRKDEVPQIEEERLEEEDIERRSKERGEWGGPKGPEPTRHGDWEKAGRCSDF